MCGQDLGVHDAGRSLPGAQAHTAGPQGEAAPRLSRHCACRYLGKSQQARKVEHGRCVKNLKNSVLLRLLASKCLVITPVL